MKKLLYFLLITFNFTIHASDASDIVKGIIKVGGVTALTTAAILPSIFINMAPAVAGEKTNKAIFPNSSKPSKIRNVSQQWQVLKKDLITVGLGTVATTAAVPLKCYNRDNAAVACLVVAGGIMTVNFVRIAFR